MSVVPCFSYSNMLAVGNPKSFAMLLVILCPESQTPTCSPAVLWHRRSPTAVLAMRPKRSATLRPMSMSSGGCDDLAHSLGLSRVQLGISMAAVALPQVRAKGLLLHRRATVYL